MTSPLIEKFRFGTHNLCSVPLRRTDTERRGLVNLVHGVRHNGPSQILRVVKHRNARHYPDQTVYNRYPYSLTTISPATFLFTEMERRVPSCLAHHPLPSSNDTQPSAGHTAHKIRKTRPLPSAQPVVLARSHQKTSKGQRKNDRLSQKAMEEHDRLSPNVQATGRRPAAGRLGACVRETVIALL